MHFVGVYTNVIRFTKPPCKISSIYFAKMGLKSLKLHSEGLKIQKILGEHAPGLS